MTSPTETLAIVASPGAPAPSFALETLTFPGPAAAEVEVDMAATGVCHSDLAFAAMPGPPRVLGHEGAGRIASLGPGVTHLAVGDPVLLSYRTCGNCAPCSSGARTCASFIPLNFARPGAFARPGDGEGQAPAVAGRFFGQSSFARRSPAAVRSVVPLRPLLPPDTPWDDVLPLLAPLGCGFMTGAGSVVNVFAATPESAVLVAGMGAVGFGAVMAAKVLGCRAIVAVDRVASRLERARELGATHVVNTAELGGEKKGWEGIVEAVRAVVPEGVDGVVETTGAEVVVQASMRVLAWGGQVVLLAQGPQDGLQIPYQDLQMVSGKVNFVTMGEADPQKLVPKMIEWWRDGKFPLEKLVKRYPIGEWEKALGAMKEGGDVVKPVIVW
ncbi:hypothetical protein SLS56_003843 [Neofusicoccum ribis]|uniref:Enoyl reductase (ER) domain-containing protein n=1 Tax=Neofusicoccum ribis TaxID=45134 RepID=A0ABR3SY50_9PEZI